MDSNKKERIVNSIKEISDKEIAKEIETIIGINSNIENYIVNLAHDLKAPINIIISIIQLLGKRDNLICDKKTMEYLDLIKKNGYKLLKMSSDLIDIEKISNDNYILKKENVEIVNFIEELIVSIDKYAKQKNINIIFDTNKENIVIAVDPDALDRMIINVISNSIKYSEPNTNIYVNVFSRNDYIQINIKDNGRGISLEKQKVIFNRFEQSQESDSFLGSGIGLDLVNSLVKAQGGSIELNSALGKGTEVIFRFPNERYKIEKSIKKLNFNDKIQRLEIEFSDIYV